MATTPAPSIPAHAHASPVLRLPKPAAHLSSLLALWCALFAGSLAAPPLLDDADATHAQAAQAMLHTGDWVTLHVDGIRYLEKAPLPYWIAALCLRLFGDSAFAVHLQLALTVLALAWLGYAWARRAFSERAAFYTALFLLTSTGVFLFTRIFIPDALLSLLLALALYSFLRALEPGKNLPANLYPYALWLALALAVLTKGLVALVFFLSSALLFLGLTRQFHLWRRLHPLRGLVLLLAVAAPWHVLAGLRNTGGERGHGFFWFYFINEHLLRFLGRRIPADYNKLPTALYWSLHLVWLFPWSLFAPAAIVSAWRRRSAWSNRSLSSRPEHRGLIAMRSGETPVFRDADTASNTFARNTVLLLLIFSSVVLVFFSLSTNQEYYTFPVYLPLLMLLAAGLTHTRNDVGAQHPGPEPAKGEMWVATDSRALTASYALFTAVGLAATLTLGYGLWTSRALPFVPDIGNLLAHRQVAHYTLSLAHFFDLTGPSFAALRLPATLAAVAFALGPATAWALHARGRDHAAVLAVASTAAVFLLAAHIALVRFTPMLSSQGFAARILALEQQHALGPDTEVLLFGDQSFGSSIPFYLDRRVLLVDGRSTSMLFGSTFPDAPPIFLTPQQLLAGWGSGPRKVLFVPLERRAEADRLLGARALLLDEASGKALLTDRPLESIHP